MYLLFQLRSCQKYDILIIYVKLTTQKIVTIYIVTSKYNLTAVINILFDLNFAIYFEAVKLG